jgi:hypothetical protein
MERLYIPYLAAFCAVLLVLPSASAQDASAAASSTARRLAVLDYELTLYAREGKRERLSSNLTSAALGALLLPVGIVLNHRDDELLQITGVGLIAGGAVQLGMSLGVFFPTDVEQVAAHHAQRKASGKPTEQVIRETEAEWKHEAEVETKAWRWAGSIQLAIGLAALPIGMTVLLKDQVGSMPHKRQINVASSLIGIGIPYLLTGVRMLFSTNPTEASWRASEGARQSWAIQTANALRVAPARGGAVFAASGRF